MVYDVSVTTPELKVMRAGRGLGDSYLGPIGLVLDILSCQEPGPGLHEEFVRPLRKLGSGLSFTARPNAFEAGSPHMTTREISVAPRR